MYGQYEDVTRSGVSKDIDSIMQTQNFYTD